MISLETLIAGLKPPISPRSMRGAATALGGSEAVSLRELLGAGSVDVTFRSYTTPKFWDDDPRGNVSSSALEMVMTTDRQVGNETWPRGRLYNLTEAGNALKMAKSDWETLRDDAIFLWDQGIVGGLESAKNGIVSGFADLINEVHPGACEQKCKANLKQTLEVAMVALGIPPDLPTTRQLVSAGASYIATELVDIAAPGLMEGIGHLGGDDALEYAQTLEPEAREAARAKLQNELETGGTSLLLPPPGNVTDNPLTWGIPNPLFLARPAVLYLCLKPRAGVDPAPARGTWSVEPSDVFAKATFHISHLPPGGVTVPVVLWPSIGQFVKKAEADAQGLDFASWYSGAFGSAMTFDPTATRPYCLFDKPGEGVSFYSRKKAVTFAVRGPGKLVVARRSDTVWNEHNISPAGELGEAVFGEVFTVAAYRASVAP